MTPIETVPMWVLAYAAIFVLLHLVVGYYVYRRSDELGVGRDTATLVESERAVETDAAVIVPERQSDGEQIVRCGHCNAENEPDYRYCRHCVQELPSLAGAAVSTARRQERESL